MMSYRITIRFLILTVAIVTASTFYGQREADIWYFGEQCGLNFNSGVPEVLHNGQTFELFGGVGTMSDSLGNLLFYSEADTIFTSQHLPMENGIGFIEGAGTQSNLIVQWPGSGSLYFVFRVPTLGPGTKGIYYSIVDMSRNNGLGAVIEKDILLVYAWDAYDKVIATLHKNKRDIWVITRKFTDDNYAAFLITPGGINETPVLSPAPDIGVDHVNRGFIKISYDKKYLFSSYWHERDVEVCRFDDETGEIGFLYDLNTGGNPVGIEFSPDSKFAYISYQVGVVEKINILQYNMDNVGDGPLFIATAIVVVDSVWNGFAVQLATDGKIYCINNGHYSPGAGYFIGAINKPWELGAACQYDSTAIYTYPGITSRSFPSIFMDYLYRFEFEGHCAGTPFLFTSNFNPVPDSIRWAFSDPGSGANNISYDINPEHSFTSGGIYEVEADVWYPSGRFEHTSREVEVEYTPLPDLGPDTITCQGDTIALNAGNDPGVYIWSTGVIGQDIFSIAVSDTGTYWVKVTNGEGCSQTDSVHIGWFDKAVINEDGLIVAPASCGISNGGITGLQVEGVGPFSYGWYDGNGIQISTDIDITGLPVGNYYLHITDGNGCTTISGSYTIADGGDIQITAVGYLSSHCLQNDGSINITAISGGGNTLGYSIDNGSIWQTGNTFNNLSPGGYFIRVQDQGGCETVYGNNPVVIANTEGPQLTMVDVSNENDYSSDGSIYLEAFVDTGDIRYSIDSGNSFQTNDGLFEGLSAGTYYCVVQDGFDCDTIFTIEVERIISQIIDAIAGDGYTCIGNATVSPLLVNNFIGVSSFHVELIYDEELVSCDEYMQVHPELEDSIQISVTNSGEVHISWHGQSPISLPDNSTMVKLVIRGVDKGLSQIDWVADQGESEFYNNKGDIINADFQLGLVTIYKRPSIEFTPPVDEVCKGEMLIIAPGVSTGTGEYTSYWLGPDNFTSDKKMLYFSKSTSNMAGAYTLTVTDTVNCVESKSMELIVNQGPAISFTPHDTLWVEPGYILAAGNDFNNSYLWNSGETTPGIIIDSTGLYGVVVTSPQDCESSDTVQILWGGEPFHLPNAFTPDSDGMDDFFGPVARYDYVKRYHMSIYNRWGQLLFETTDINQGWDGTYQGSQCITGAYIYRIVYGEFGQQQVESKVVEGTVMLVR